jgi:hypothetical protein
VLLRVDDRDDEEAEPSAEVIGARSSSESASDRQRARMRGRGGRRGRRLRLGYGRRRGSLEAVEDGLGRHAVDLMPAEESARAVGPQRW